MPNNRMKLRQITEQATGREEIRKECCLNLKK